MKTEQMVQQENIDELIRLQKENPDARIMCFVSEECNNGDFSYMSANFGKPRLENMALINNYWLDDEEEIKENIACDIDEEFDSISRKEFEEMVEKKFEEIIEEIIVIYIESY